MVDDFLLPETINVIAFHFIFESHCQLLTHKSYFLCFPAYLFDSNTEFTLFKKSLESSLLYFIKSSCCQKQQMCRVTSTLLHCHLSLTCFPMLRAFLLASTGVYIIHITYKLPKYPSAGRTVEESLQCAYFMGRFGDILWF